MGNGIFTFENFRVMAYELGDIGLGYDPLL